jgi:NAD(P)-dependent dehydrogenase (short-subunit alcohol dehydrogenase family)
MAGGGQLVENAVMSAEQKPLSGRVAIVTGAGGGLGRAYALALAAAGARVLVNDIQSENARAVAEEIRRAGGTALADAGDVSDWASAARIVAACRSELGGADVLVNNAGLTHAKPIWEEDEAGFERLMRVNLKGTFAMTRQVVGYMIERRAGSIINITSGAQEGHAPASAYSASKGGVASATYTWAVELAQFGIRVNAVSPVAETPMNRKSRSPDEIPPLRRPEVIAPLIVYLASDASRGITGQVFRLSGLELSLYSHPRPLYPARNERAWTFETLRDRVKQEFGSRLEPVGFATTTYDYDS